MKPPVSVPLPRPGTRTPRGPFARAIAGDSSAPVVHVAVLDASPTRAAPPFSHALAATGPGLELVRFALDATADPNNLRDVDVVVLKDEPGGDAAPESPLLDVLSSLRKRQIGTAVVTDRPWMFAGFTSGVVCVPSSASAELLRGVCLSLAHLRPVLRQLDGEMLNLERLGRQIARHLEEINQELRLAARLQHDFLPRQLPGGGCLRFASLFRPYSWVSGDTFDIFRLDEHRVGFYVADAVGHGLAAGLLTMLIKNAIQMARVSGGGGFVSPGHILARLNEAMAAQELPDSQFITAWYGVIDESTRVLRYASGGHPPPMVIDADGSARALTSDGCLVGVFPDQQFVECEETLASGQRLLLFSDGIEHILLAPCTAENQPRRLSDEVVPLATRPAGELIAWLQDRLDREPGGLYRADDVTLIVVDVD